MKFVHVVPGGFLDSRVPILYLVEPVGRHPVPHLVLDNVHPDFLQLLAQLPDVIAHDPVMDVHIGAVIEHGKRTADIDFQSGSDVLGFLFLLHPKLVVQVLQNGHFLRDGIVQILPVHQPDTAVNDGLFHRGQSILAAHNQLTQGQNEVRFQR